MNSNAGLVTFCFVATAGLACAQPVGLTGRLEGRSSSSNRSVDWPSVGFASARSADVRAGLEAASDRPWTSVEQLGRLWNADKDDGEVTYYLALLYERLYERETGVTRARTYDQRTRYFLRETVESGDAPWAGLARTWLDQRSRYTPLERRVLLAGHELRRGDRGPAVREIQERIGSGVDGDFGPKTEAALSEWQELSGLEPTGRVDEATLALHQEYSEVGVHWSSSDAWKDGRRLGRIQVVSINNRVVELRTARAYEQMRLAAAADGVTIKVVSGFRSYGHQSRLYDRYRAGTGNPADRPGYSNHQDGRALDLNANATVLPWLRANASTYGFKNTVRREPWHWEYRPELFD